MGEDLLKKLKGFSRTFVVHSNINPYAAVAVAGMMAARSQEAGPYFCVLDQFVPMLEALPPEKRNSPPAAHQIELDFKSDWIGYLRITGLPACGLKYKEKLSPEENTIRFLNAYNRRIPPAKPRKIHMSQELLIPPQFQQDYEALIALIQAGSDLKPYLSRHIVKRKRPDWNDGLLNSWGIQHLHFRREGTGHLLFCVITDTDVYLIQVLPHVEEEWANSELIQILHDNWPETIARANHSLMKPETFSTSKRQSLRSYNANFAGDGSERNGLSSPCRRNNRIWRLHRRPLQLQKDFRRTQILAGDRRVECLCNSLVSQPAGCEEANGTHGFRQLRLLFL
ncbi:MAG: hypothetical protein WAL75_27545 [Terracidiphilus sp.]